MKIKLDDIITTAGTQMRVQLNIDAVEEYMQTEDLPPVTVFDDDGKLYLADGFHRFEARLRNNEEYIQCKVEKGTLREAILFAVSANAEHGVRRTNADKRRSVETLLKDDEWGTWSGREIARICRVDEKMVRRLRDTLTADKPQLEDRKYKTKHGTTTMMKTGNIGKTQPDKPKKKITGGTAFNTEEFEDDEPEEPVVEPVQVEDVEEDAGFDNLEYMKEVKRLFLKWNKEVNAIQEEMLELSKDRLGSPLRQAEQTIINRCKNLSGFIMAEKPYCVCFICDGEGCLTCDDAGWMDKIRHNSNSPEGKTVVKI